MREGRGEGQGGKRREEEEGGSFFLASSFPGPYKLITASILPLDTACQPGPSFLVAMYILISSSCCFCIGSK